MGREEENALVEQFQDLVAKTAKRRFSSHLPDDDLMQSGLIGLWEASQKWTGNGEFEPFARVCIYHNMLDYVRSLNAKRWQSGEELQEDDEPTVDYFDDLDVMELIDDIDKAWPSGSIENKVLRGLALNLDKRTLAAQMGLDTYRVTRIAKKAWRAVLSVREQNNSTG